MLTKKCSFEQIVWILEGGKKKFALVCIEPKRNLKEGYEQYNQEYTFQVLAFYYEMCQITQ